MSRPDPSASPRSPKATPHHAPHLPFGAPGLGSQRVATLTRARILAYLIPAAVALALASVVLSLAFDKQVSPFAYFLLSTCGLSFALHRLGRSDAAVGIFMVSSYLTLVTYCLPVFGNANGLASGSAYTFSMYPLVAWLCYAHRGIRLTAAFATGCAIAVLFAIGQLPHAIQVTDDVFILAAVRIVFATGITLAAARVFELAVHRGTHEQLAALEEARELNQQLGHRQRDLEREAAAHRATLEHLTRSESRLRYLFDHAFDGIVVFDGATNRPQAINRRLPELLGYTERELSALTPLDVSPERQPDGRASVAAREALVGRLAAGETFTYDWTHVHRRGHEVHFEITTFPLPAEPNIRMSVFRDVSAERANAAQLEAVNRELRVFAHAASHDLKEPLRTMANFAKLLGRRYSDVVDESGQQYIAYINEAAARGTRLVHDLLAYAKAGTAEVEIAPTSLGCAADAVRRNVAARLGQEGAELVIGELPRVLATATWAEQLLQNLVSNALKFQRPGVAPRVYVGTVADPPEGTCEVYVRDNGIGIAGADQARVFGAFERLVGRDRYEGSGLGLALCRRIMRRLGGSIRVESELGVGTTFTLRFRAVEPAAATTVREAALV